MLVVGGGPAGAATARLLALEGHRVMLIDRAAFPRPKPCGDCLSAAATGPLERLGVLESVLAEAPARLGGWRIVAPDGAAFDGRFDRTACRTGDAAGHRHSAASDSPADAPGSEVPSASPTRFAGALALPRARLDHVLVRAAERAGAEIRTGVRVTGLLRDPAGAVVGVRAMESEGRPVELRARLVVGADGLRSVVARRLGLVRRRPRLRKIALTAHVRGVHGVDRHGEMHLVRGACAGIAPVGAGALHNLTLVVDAAAHGRVLAHDPEAFFWRTLRRFDALAPSIEAAELAGPASRLLASGPFDWPMRDVVADGAALVGDAAGYYDPFTGQGIYRALRSAELLAETACAALRAGRPTARRLRAYARRRARLVRGSRRLQRVIEFAIARPAVVARAARALRRSPTAADHIVRVTGDLDPPRSLFAPRLLVTLLVDQFLARDSP